MYYNLRLAWEPEVIGVKNGVYQVELDKKAHDKSAFYKIDSLFISNDFSINQAALDCELKFYFKKLKSAKKTSLMSFTPYLNHCHFLIHKSPP